MIPGFPILALNSPSLMCHLHFACTAWDLPKVHNNLLCICIPAPHCKCRRTIRLGGSVRLLWVPGSLVSPASTTADISSGFTSDHSTRRSPPD